jgi:hypothetical protein
VGDNRGKPGGWLPLKLAFPVRNVHHAAVDARPICFTVTRADAGLRLDQLLAKRVPGLSRRTARKVLALGGVFVEGSPVRIASKTIQPAHKVEVHLGDALENATEAKKEEPL